MSGNLKRYLLAVGLFLTIPMLALATLSFKHIDRPGAVDTLVNGINDSGWIVGTSETADQAAAFTEEGYLLRGKNYKTIFFPGAFDTDLGGINDRGVIFGTYGATATNGDHCFQWSEQGGYTDVSIPVEGATFPDCNGINVRGDMVGSYVGACDLVNDPFCNSSGTVHGFLKTKAGVFTTLDVPFAGATGTEARGINEDGDIVGTYVQTSGPDGAFLLHEGVYTRININGTTSVDAYGINEEGDIVGSYTKCQTSGEFPTCEDHGFLLSEGKLTTIDVPFADAKETNKVTGINEDGWMVGVYTDNGLDGGHEHGFKVRNRGNDR